MNAFFIGTLPTVLGNKRAIKRDNIVGFIYIYVIYITQSNMETVLHGSRIFTILHTLKQSEGKVLAQRNF